MKLEFLAQLDEVKGKKDHGFKWVLESGQDSLEEAAQAMAIVNAQLGIRVTMETVE